MCCLVSSYWQSFQIPLRYWLLSKPIMVKGQTLYDSNPLALQGDFTVKNVVYLEKCSVCVCWREHQVCLVQWSILGTSIRPPCLKEPAKSPLSLLTFLLSRQLWRVVRTWSKAVDLHVTYFESPTRYTAFETARSWSTDSLYIRKCSSVTGTLLSPARDQESFLGMQWYRVRRAPSFLEALGHCRFLSLHGLTGA